VEAAVSEIESLLPSPLSLSSSYAGRASSFERRAAVPSVIRRHRYRFILPDGTIRVYWRQQALSRCGHRVCL